MKIIQSVFKRYALLISIGIAIVGCNEGGIKQNASNTVGAKQNIVQQPAVRKELSLLKDITNLSINGHEPNLKNSSYPLSQSTYSGLYSPQLIANQSGSNVSSCIYNADSQDIYLSTHDTVESNVFKGGYIKIKPNHYGCLDQMRFLDGKMNPYYNVLVSLSPDFTDAFKTRLNITDIAHPLTTGVKAISGADENMGYFGFAAGGLVDKNSFMWSPDTDSSWTTSVPMLNYGEQYIVNNNQIMADSKITSRTAAIVAIVFIIIILVLFVVTIAFSVYALCSPATYISMLGIVGMLTGSGTVIVTLVYFAVMALFSDANSYTPSSHNDYSRGSSKHLGVFSYDNNGNQVGYYENETGKGLGYIFGADSHSLGSIAGENLLVSKGEIDYTYTNVLPLCFNSRKDFSQCPAKGEFLEALTKTTGAYPRMKMRDYRAVIVVGLDDPQSILTTDVIKDKVALANQQYADFVSFNQAGGPKGDWRNGNTRYDESTANIIDSGDTTSGAIPEIFSYGLCKLGSNVNYVNINQSTANMNVMPFGMYRTLCKNINYNSSSGLLTADCPNSVPNAVNNVSNVNEELRPTFGLLATSNNATCQQVSFDNGVFSCVTSQNGTLSDFPMSATIASQCNATANTSGNIWTLTCVDKATLQVGKPLQVNKTVLVGKEASYVGGKLNVTSTLPATSKMLSCETYNISVESNVRPGQSVLKAFGAKFVNDSFDPITGNYIFNYADKLDVTHQIGLNIYQNCLSASDISMGTELRAKVGSNPNAVEFTLSCLRPKNGPELYSSVVSLVNNVPLYKQDPASGIIVLNKEYNMYKDETIMLNYYSACTYGSGIRIEDLVDQLSGNRYRTFTCMSSNVPQADIPSGNYQSKCSNIYYSKASGYLQAICKKNDNTSMVSTLNTRYEFLMPNKSIDAIDGVLTVVNK